MIRKLDPRRLVKRFRRHERGVAAIEFALIIPILVLLLLGCFEVPRYVLVWQRMARTSSGVADLLAQADEPMTGNQMDDIVQAAKVMMQPYDIIANGNIVVDSVNNPSGGGAKVTWRKIYGSGGNQGKVGKANDTPVIPTNLMPASGEEVLTSEVYFNYRPIFSTLIYNGSTLYMIAYTRPRNHNLMTCPGSATAAGSSGAPCS
jgi:Flp pilus assembly protein TadG